MVVYVLSILHVFWFCMSGGIAFVDFTFNLSMVLKTNKRQSIFVSPKKGLNELKHVPRAWYEKIAEFLLFGGTS